jgi:hypothetical protein
MSAPGEEGHIDEGTGMMPVASPATSRDYSGGAVQMVCTGLHFTSHTVLLLTSPIRQCKLTTNYIWCAGLVSAQG